MRVGWENGRVERVGGVHQLSAQLRLKMDDTTNKYKKTLAVLLLIRIYTIIPLIAKLKLVRQPL